VEVNQMTAFNQVDNTLEDLAEGDVKQFRHMFLVTVLLFLPVILVMRLLPRSIRPWDPDSGEKKSIFAEAKAVANAFLPFAFMG
jgi:hypothetical protein